MPHSLHADSRVVIASHNKGKVAEISALLSERGLRSDSAKSLGVSDVEETGESFEENALIKAQHTAASANCVALSDDSGIVIPALGGLPGIHTGRWAGENRDFRAAMAKVNGMLEALKGQADRRATYVTVLALAWPDSHARSFRGEVYGQLVWPPRGEFGSGFEPMFLPDGSNRTFGEMRFEEKQRLNPRAIAFQKLVEELLLDA